MRNLEVTTETAGQSVSLIYPNERNPRIETSGEDCIVTFQDVPAGFTLTPTGTNDKIVAVIEMEI